MAVKYWVGSPNHGHMSNPNNMFNEFKKDSFWSTDLKLKIRNNKAVADALEGIKVNDRFAISSLRNKYRDVHIIAIGTVTGIDSADQGKLDIDWDEDQELYQGVIPLGTKNENWQLTLIQLTTNDNITLIFPDAIINKKVARLAWNTLGWRRPSGLTGKATAKDTHEGKFGYGPDEWMFDTSKVIDGYQYGFLEPIRKGQTTHAGKAYPIWLYGIDGQTKKRYWLGEIKRAIVLNEEEANNIKKEYKKHKWLEKMEGEIASSGANKEGFSEYTGLDLFNIKFKPEDLIINKEPIELPEDHPANKITRYSFANFNEAFQLVRV